MSLLAEACFRLKDQIANEFDIGDGDAVELFLLIWNEMTEDAGAMPKGIAAAAVTVEESFLS
jgi:hypothetical protein